MRRRRKKRPRPCDSDPSVKTELWEHTQQRPLEQLEDCHMFARVRTSSLGDLNVLRLYNTLFCRYAMGGFDGVGMVNSIEVFDPRAGCWVEGDPMNSRRGYAATAVLERSIYVIGGLELDKILLDTVCNSILFP